jgi:hypothetical protein
MNQAIFNLEDYRSPDSRIFTGRDKGKYVRKTSKFDEMERISDSVKFIIPDDLYSINPSFFEELLINVVSKLGKEKFLRKYIFENRGSYNYSKPLMDAIDRILRESNAL